MPRLTPRRAFASLAVVASAHAMCLRAESATPELVWETTGFSAPESVVFDAARDQFYVSNMASWGEGQISRDGFISRVSHGGSLLELKWITGLENPKGLAMVGDRLFVGDDDALVEIDVGAGAVAARHAPPDGPGEFNDCTADPEGRVYVFSARVSTVFRLADGAFESWQKFDTSGTGYINGLLAERDRLLLGGWMVHRADGTEEPGFISMIDLATHAVGRLGTESVGHIDGLEPDGLGGYTATDWVTGAVVGIAADGRVSPLMNLGEGVADHTYLASRDLLVFPLMKQDKLQAYRWRP